MKYKIPQVVSFFNLADVACFHECTNIHVEMGV